MHAYKDKAHVPSLGRDCFLLPHLFSQREFYVKTNKKYIFKSQIPYYLTDFSVQSEFRAQDLVNCVPKVK